MRALNAVNMLSRRDARVLVILDNVEAWDGNSQPSPLPVGTRVTLLVTTRRSRLGGNRFRAFELSFLRPAEARALVTTLAGEECAARPGFQKLLDFLDGHALAVELAGVYLHEYPEVTPEAYLVALKAGRGLDAKVADGIRYEQSVTQAFALLWQRLGDDTRCAWQLASWAFLDGVATRARRIDISAGFRVYTPDRAHFGAALDLTSGAEQDVEIRRTLLDRIATACQSMGELTRASVLFEEALASDIANLGEDHPAVATRRFNLASVCEQEGDLPAALELLREALRAELITLGAEHPSLAMTRAKGASLLSRLGDRDAAVREAREALRIVAKQPEGSFHRKNVEILVAGIV